jgi:hypothetical protein
VGGALWDCFVTQMLNVSGRMTRVLLPGRLVDALGEAQERGWTIIDVKKEWKRVFPFE